MINISTGSNTIHRYDYALDNDVCDKIYDYALKCRVHACRNTLPWLESNSFRWEDLSDLNLKKHIFDYRCLVNSLVNKLYELDLYPEYTDIVYWSNGKSMQRHRDDGYSSIPNLSGVRIISSVTYINDNYLGGETYIKTEHGYDYVSKPKKGTVVIFKSDDTNVHGVNTITHGDRVTLPIWFCTNKKLSEDLKLESKIKDLK